MGESGRKERRKVRIENKRKVGEGKMRVRKEKGVGRGKNNEDEKGKE